MNTFRIDIGEPANTDAPPPKGEGVDALNAAVDKAYDEYLARWAREIRAHIEAAGKGK